LRITAHLLLGFERAWTITLECTISEEEKAITARLSHKARVILSQDKGVFMKRNIILLIDADADTHTATLTAAQIVGLDIRVAQIHDVSEISDLGLDDVAAIVIDYDPDVHGPAIAKELPQWLPPRPLIFISSESEHGLLFDGAAARSLVKPVTAAQVVHALDAILNHRPAASCDRWGHTCNGFARSDLDEAIELPC
jgi:hypothetical protein